MIACVDVDYRGDTALAACVLIRSWTDAEAAAELREPIPHVEAYQPGEFYKRELPCILVVLAKTDEPNDMIVVDGWATSRSLAWVRTCTLLWARKSR
jgi:deoxyribonuclease V